MRKRDVLAIIEGAYAAQLLFFLHDSGLLARLRSPIRPEVLAKRTGYDPAGLAPVCEFLCRTSDVLIRSSGGRVRLNMRSDSAASIGFQLDKFVGAYGLSVRSIGTALRPETSPPRSVDGVLLARAFSHAAPPEAALACVLSLRPKNILELACGTAPLLRAVCSIEPGVSGIGLDADTAMCRAARRAVAGERLQDRIRIMRGDARQLAQVLVPARRATVDLLFAQSLLNAFCTDRREGVVTFLRHLKAMFPGRSLLVVDYHGTLATPRKGRQRYRVAALQDVAQLASGQGLPPENQRALRALYRRSGCRLTDAFEQRDDHLHWFMSLLEL